MNITPEPTVEIGSSCETLQVRLSHTKHITTGQYTSGTQIMQYQYDGREYEWQESKIDEGGFINVVQETPLGERLITTPYLKKYGLSFNTHYQLLICTACAEGLPISYVYTHLTKPGGARLNKTSTSEWAAYQVVYQHELAQLSSRLTCLLWKSGASRSFLFALHKRTPSEASVA